MPLNLEFGPGLPTEPTTEARLPGDLEKSVAAPLGDAVMVVPFVGTTLS